MAKARFKNVSKVDQIFYPNGVRTVVLRQDTVVLDEEFAARYAGILRRVDPVEVKKADAEK